MLTPVSIDCPYCGESIEILIDESVAPQRYIEDCQVCCRPITVRVEIDADGELLVAATGENDV
ncbi:MAG TPA: CPXCG motif-containing cysteine-rich protein [Rhodanobacter sp.]|nr:CPXCG motif-containing cysteine-rich protein [Rhodanobacter sp.]